MKLIYVAGAFRGPKPWDVYNNVIAAERAALEVARVGAVPVCPHAMYRNYDGLLTDDFWLAAGLKLLEACDALYVFEPVHSRTSSGTRGEIARAKELGKPILWSWEGLRSYLAAWP